MRRKAASTFRGGQIFLLFLFVTSAQCLDSHYDFIIVGGGTAGCVLASRLSENSNTRVLLIESGGVPKPGMEIPALAPKFTDDLEVSWHHHSLPQRYAGRSNSGKMTLVSGRVLGGSSSINYMYFNRGSPLDYDNWATLAKDDSWKYENMMEYFKKMENYEGDYHTDQHGYHGPLTVSQPRYAPGLETWLAAGKELGYSVGDPNGPQRVSFTPVEFSKRRGQRDSSFTAYIKPILFSRPNLHILLNTNVTQIIFEGNHATGIVCHTKGEPVSKRFYSMKEIILSAGVIGSPVLLQMSGVGPQDLLESAKIKLVKDLPVGVHFQDHVTLPVTVTVNNDSLIMDENRDLTPENLQLFRLFADGPYSNTRGGGGQCFGVSSVAMANNQPAWPDIQIAAAHSRQQYAISPGTTSESSLGGNSTTMSVVIFLTRPNSRGSVYINPKNLSGPPLLDLGYFSDPRDMRTLTDALKEVVRIFEETSAYKKYSAQVTPFNYPACQNRVYKTEQFWRCYIRQASLVGNHAGGTCRMGPGLADPDSVVDSELRVNGVGGLRVADASIMPTQPNANTQVAVYAIAEKAAQMILNYWSVSHHDNFTFA